jgi:hypothetical protein
MDPVDGSRGSLQESPSSILAQPAGNEVLWKSPTYHRKPTTHDAFALLPNSRKRTRYDGVVSSIEADDESPVTKATEAEIEDSEKNNAVNFIKDWLVRYPEIFPQSKEIVALSDLCRLPQPMVQTLLNQTLRLGKSDAMHPKQDQPRNKRAKTIPESQPLRQEVTCPSDTMILGQAALWVKERGPKCRPVQDPALLCRDETRIYQCTLQCGSRFRRKDDWRRHEEQNYPQEGWICNLNATTVVNGVLTCVYCDSPSPAIHHAKQSHRKGGASKHCQDKPLDARGRISFRKEHFVHHLEKIHPIIPTAEYVIQSHFLIDSNFPRSCGFCPRYEFRRWQERIEHISGHFEDKRDMSSWERPHHGYESHNADKISDRDLLDSNKTNQEKILVISDSAAILNIGESPDDSGGGSFLEARQDSRLGTSLHQSTCLELQNAGKRPEQSENVGISAPAIIESEYSFNSEPRSYRQ